MSDVKTKNATISDVAEQAGVSIKTVSRVFNNEKYVSKAKKDKILEIADKLNYRPSLQARGLAGSKSYMVGLFVDDPSGDYVTKVLRGIVNRCEEAGWHLVVEVFRRKGDAGKLRQVLNSIRFDGVILSPPICDDIVVLEALKDSNIPAVRISPGVEFANMPKIEIDDYQAAFDMTDYMIRQGHKRVGFIKGDPNHACSLDRERGYIRALQHHGMQVETSLMAQGMFSYPSGREAAAILLSQDEPPTGIFASNDEMAAGVLSVARERGVAVPEELSIAGFDDDIIANRVSPALTTIHQPVEEMAAAAFDLLMADDSDSGIELNTVYPYDLRIRPSVRRLS